MADQFRTKNYGRPSLLALIFGMLAFFVSVTHYWLGPIDASSASETTDSRMQDSFIAILKGTAKAPTESPITTWHADEIVATSVAVVSMLAILLAIIGYVRHENFRMVGSAVVLGGLALSFQYLIIAIILIAIAIIVGTILNGFDC